MYINCFDLYNYIVFNITILFLKFFVAVTCIGFTFSYAPGNKNIF